MLLGAWDLVLLLPPDHLLALTARAQRPFPIVFDSWQRNLNADAVRAPEPAVVLAAETFVIEALDLLRVCYRKHRSVALYLQDVPAIKPAGLHARKAARRIGRVSSGRLTSAVIDRDLDLPRLKH